MEAADLIAAYKEHIATRDFPCIAAKTALAKEQVHCLVVDHMACPKDDQAILHFLYAFIDDYRASPNVYNSAVVIFKGPEKIDEETFDRYFWQRLQAIADMDATRYGYDTRVDRDPASPKFSFSLKEEAFYIIGLHPASSRRARRFKFPSLVFNAHSQFEKLREDNKYASMRKAVRKRDVKFSGSVNPMLAEFGEESEVFQYTGRQYDKNWKCPFIARHVSAANNPAA
jgi:FPC/CPF motif-containing protein YcgG